MQIFKTTRTMGTLPVDTLCVRAPNIEPSYKGTLTVSCVTPDCRTILDMHVPKSRLKLIAETPDRL